MSKRQLIVIAIIFIVLYALNIIVYKNSNILYNCLLTVYLLYLLGYVLFKLSNFSINKILDVFFLIIFLMSLLIPTISINYEDFSLSENRTLSKLMPFIKDKKINYNFGNEFDSWFKDRFYLRDKLINVYYIYIKNINDIIVTQNGFYNKKSNVMFKFNYKYNKNFYQGLDAQILFNLALLNKFCKNHDITLYVLIIPAQIDILYDDFYPLILRRVFFKKNIFMNKLLEDNRINIVYPNRELNKASFESRCYFKTDQHWTDYCAYAGYKAIVSRIQKDFPEVNLLSEKYYKITKSNKVRSDWQRTYNNGDVFEHVFPFWSFKANKILDTEYLYYDNIHYNILQQTIIDEPHKRQKIFYYPYGSNLRVLQIGTSGNENLMQFIPYTFKHVKYIRLNGVKEQNEKDDFKIMKLYKKEILDYKPNILIFSIFTGNLFQMNKLFKED